MWGIHWWRQQQTQRKRWCSTAANTGAGPNDGNKELLFLNLDLKGMKENQKQLAESIQHRKVEANIGEVVCLFDQTTKLQHQVRALRTRRNLVAKARGKSAAAVTEEEEEEAKQLRAELKGLEEELDAVERRLLSEAKRVPNYIHRDVPVGNSGSQQQEAKVLRHVGQKPQFTAERPALDHLTLCTKLGLLDLEAGHRVSGNKKFCFLKGAGALLEMALIQCALLHATRHGFTPFTVPELVRHAAAEGAGFQPRDPSPVNQTYALKSSDHCLVATAEIPLAAYYLNCTLPVEKLPLKMVAFSHCFRTEAGSAGIRDKGLYRLHQFSKVEMFAIGTPDMSEQLHEEACISTWDAAHS
ncbi:serine--tRNA ligase [Balamuthia mandrillaris]